MVQETVVELQEMEKQNSGCSINDARVSETVITIHENSQDLRSSQQPTEVSVADVVRDSENRSSNSGESCATETKVAENKDEKKSWVVEIKCGEEENCDDSELLCRICHLSSEQPWKFPIFAAKTDLMLLGCGCKGELGVAHFYCAEAWFKLKGNRICEICGRWQTMYKGWGMRASWKSGKTAE